MPLTTPDSANAPLAYPAQGRVYTVGSPWPGFGNAAAFTGIAANGDGIDLGASKIFTVSGVGAASAFTLEAKVKPEVLRSQVIAGRYAAPATAVGSVNALLYMNNIGNFVIIARDRGGILQNVTSTVAATANSLYDVAASYDGTLLRLFVNGVSSGTPLAFSGCEDPDSTTHFYIGRDTDSGNSNSPWQGIIDEVRLSNTARYVANYTPATTPFAVDANTLMLMHLDDSIPGQSAPTSGIMVDAVPRNSPLVLGYYASGPTSPGAPYVYSKSRVVAAQSGFGNAISFENSPNSTTADYVGLVGPRSNANPVGLFPGGTQPFTWDFRINVTNPFPGNTDSRPIIGFSNDTGYYGSYAAVAETSSTTYIVIFYFSTGNGTISVQPSTGTMNYGTTYALAVQFNGSRMDCWLNGAFQQADTGLSKLDGPTANQSFFLGGQASFNSTVRNGGITGTIDEVRISKIARYTPGSSYTVAAAPFTADANTAALWHLDTLVGHAAKPRVFTSTQTAPNTGGLYDHRTATGTASNSTTVAAFSGATGATTILFLPDRTNSGNLNLPAVGPNAQGQGWVDVTPESSDQVTYDPGYWGVRVRLAKGGQTVAADITVRITVVTYLTNAAHTVLYGEIGRATLPDTVLSTADYVATGGFTTSSPTVSPPGSLIQTEVYCQNVVAGQVAPPATAVNVTFYTEVPVPNISAEYTAIPDFTLQSARTNNESSTFVDNGTRKITTARTNNEMPSLVDSPLRIAAVTRRTSDSSSLTDAGLRAAVFPRAPAGGSTSTVDVASRGLGVLRQTSESFTVIESAARTLGRIIIATDANPAMVATAIKASIYGRNARHYFTPTDPTINVPTKSISGTIRNNDSTPFTAGATVLLVRDSDGYVAQTQTSQADGSYSFVRDAFDIETYHVEAYAIVAGTPEQAISQRGLAPA